jgi:hypothetical protein
MALARASKSPGRFPSLVAPYLECRPDDLEEAIAQFVLPMAPVGVCGYI